jgi:hypothetical protein
MGLSNYPNIVDVLHRMIGLHLDDIADSDWLVYLPMPST